MLDLFNIFHENKDSHNCAQVLEEEVYKVFGITSLYMSMIAMLLV